MSKELKKAIKEMEEKEAYASETHLKANELEAAVEAASPEEKESAIETAKTAREVANKAASEAYAAQATVATLKAAEEEESKKDDEKPDNKIKKAIVNCARLNIREKPSKESAILCVVNKGDNIDITSVKNKGWVRVNTDNDIKGFAMEEFLKEV